MPTTLKKELLKQQKQISKDLRELNDQQDNVNEQLLDLTIPKRIKQIGKCYIYHNGNGEEHWPLFARIVGIVGNQFQIIQFEHMPKPCYRASLEIRLPFLEYSGNFDNDSWREISFEAFETAYEEQIQKPLSKLEDSIFEDSKTLQKNVTKGE